MEHNHEDLIRQCAGVAETLCARYRWHLLDREELTRRIMCLIATQQQPNPQRAAVGVYSAALYVACSGAEGSERREQAFTELWFYLFNCARWRYPEISQDVVQSALEQIYASLDRCREPVAFLAYALQALRNAARADRRHIHHETASLEAWCDSGGTPPTTVELDGPIIADERQRAIGRVVAASLQRYPRARQQLNALWLTYVEGLDDHAIGERLGVSVNAVYVLRSRARTRLRADPAWCGLASQFGLAPE